MHLTFVFNLARTKRMREAKKEAEELANAYRVEKEASYQASMQKVRGNKTRTAAEHANREVV